MQFIAIIIELRCQFLFPTSAHDNIIHAICAPILVCFCIFKSQDLFFYLKPVFIEETQHFIFVLIVVTYGLVSRVSRASN